MGGRAWRGWRCGTGAPVVPVALEGTDRAQPRGRAVPRPGRIGVRFGAPLRFAGPAADGPRGRATRAITDEIMTAIQELSGQEYVDSYAPPPRQDGLDGGRGAPENRS
ncbi:hypothetical protein [Actinomadura sp. CNU-125]|uniref:lysophospholipid acyltransferase family protein n=1 Tax=Actinomadura sp. CNU-125 TaxID=1904961 RepID=UPI000AA37181|nr:hypothetical protein [Actinomadura sp. CNU-125]